MMLFATRWTRNSTVGVPRIRRIVKPGGEVGAINREDIGIVVGAVMVVSANRFGRSNVDLPYATPRRQRYIFKHAMLLLLRV